MEVLTIPNSSDYVTLSSLIFTYCEHGGDLSNIMPSREVRMLMDRLDGLLYIPEDNQLEILGKLIRKKSAEVLRIGEDDAA